ncbi:hypothetical protein BH10CYA1_BH10CYA1_32130 [soil metagenome]
MRIKYEIEGLCADFPFSEVHPTIDTLRAQLATQSKRLIEFQHSCLRLGNLYALIEPTLVAKTIALHRDDSAWIGGARTNYIENALTFLSEWLHSYQCRREIAIGKLKLKEPIEALYFELQQLEASSAGSRNPLVAAMKSCLLATPGMDTEVPDHQLQVWDKAAEKIPIRTLQAAAFMALDSSLKLPEQRDLHSDASAVGSEENLSVPAAELRRLRVVLLLDNVKQHYPIAFELVGLLKEAEVSLMNFEHAAYKQGFNWLQQTRAYHDERLCQLLVENSPVKIMEESEFHDENLLLSAMNHTASQLMDQRRNDLVELLVLAFKKSLDEHNQLLSSDPEHSRTGCPVDVLIMINNFLAADLLIRKLRRVKLCCSDSVDLSPLDEAFSKVRSHFESIDSPHVNATVPAF